MSKTFFRMILFSGLLTIFLTLSFSFVAQSIFENVTADNMYAKNIKELNIISDFVERMHNTTQQLTYGLSEDASLDAFLRGSSMDSADAYLQMIELKESIKTNPMIHSVSLYSGYTGEYFSTLTSRSGEDSYFKNLVESQNMASMLQPYYRALPSDIYHTSDVVFSYFYFETDNDGNVTKAINVNLDASQLCSYLDTLKGNNTHTYIIDLHNQYLLDGSTQIHSLDDTNLTFSRKILDADTEQGCFTDKSQGEEQLITFQVMQQPNWILITEEPNTDFQNAMNTVLQYLILLMALLIIAGLAFSFLFFRRLYKPWGTLYQQISTDRESAPLPSRLYDDVQAIQDSIQLTQNQLTDFLKYQNSTRNVLLEAYIRALLREDAYFIEKLADSDRRDFEAFLTQPAEIAVLRVAHWTQIKSNLPGSSDACTYSLMQISNQIFLPATDKPAYKWVYLEKGQFLLLFFPELAAGSREGFQKSLAELQQHFTSQTGLSATIAVGGTSSTCQELLGACREALTLLKTSILYERQCILPLPQPKEESDSVAHSEQLENALLEAVCSGQSEEAARLLEELIQTYRQGNQEIFVLYLTQFFLRLDKRLYTAGKLQDTQAGIPFTFYHILSEAESLDDIRELFMDDMEKLPSVDDSASSKTTLLVSSIKDYILAHYPEDISLKFLSAKFNLSQGYLGAIFKDTLGISVFEYINQVRLDAAAKMLIETNLNTKTIMGKCGFINESNFYKLFKARFDVTPKTYRTQNRPL